MTFPAFYLTCEHLQETKTRPFIYINANYLCTVDPTPLATIQTPKRLSPELRNKPNSEILEPDEPNAT